MPRLINDENALPPQLTRQETSVNHPKKQRKALGAHNDQQPKLRSALQPLSAAPLQPRAQQQHQPLRVVKQSEENLTSRHERSQRRVNVVIDPCQAHEQRRLLAEALPLLQNDGSSRVVEHSSAAPRDDLTAGDTLSLGRESNFIINGVLGEGSYGKVFSAQPVVVSLGRRPPPRPPVAVKVSCPPQLWEWTIHRALAARLPPAALEKHVVPATAAHIFGAAAPASIAERNRSVSVIVQPLASGTLQGFIEQQTRRGDLIPPECALFLVSDLLRAVSALHGAAFLHADLRPDNIALRSAAAEALDAGLTLGEETGGGWDAHGIALLDFGRAIDLKRYPAGTAFSGDAMADGYACNEMRKKKAWVHQVDYFALAATAHALLFTSSTASMSLESSAGRWRPKALHPAEAAPCPVALELWSELFDQLLNAPTDGSQLDLDGLAGRMQAYFDNSRARRDVLKAGLKRCFTTVAEHAGGKAGGDKACGRRKRTISDNLAH